MPTSRFIVLGAHLLQCCVHRTLVCVFLAHGIFPGDYNRRLLFSQSQAVFYVNGACLFCTSRYYLIKLGISAICMSQISCFFIKTDCILCHCSHLSEAAEMLIWPSCNTALTIPSKALIPPTDDADGSRWKRPKEIMTNDRLVDGDLDVTSAVTSHIWILNYAYNGYRCIVDGNLDATSAVPSHIWILNYAYNGYRCI